MQTAKRRAASSGCGGYGTLFPFVFGVIIGGPWRSWAFRRRRDAEAAGPRPDSARTGQSVPPREQCFPKGEEPLHACGRH